jgi:hypothetical protein
MEHSDWAPIGHWSICSSHIGEPDMGRPNPMLQPYPAPWSITLPCLCTEDTLKNRNQLPTLERNAPRSDD